MIHRDPARNLLLIHYRHRFSQLVRGLAYTRAPTSSTTKVPSRSQPLARAWTRSPDPRTSCQCSTSPGLTLPSTLRGRRQSAARTPASRAPTETSSLRILCPSLSSRGESLPSCVAVKGRHQVPLVYTNRRRFPKVASPVSRKRMELVEEAAALGSLDLTGKTKNRMSIHTQVVSPLAIA